jgi:hypothetical protein
MYIGKGLREGEKLKRHNYRVQNKKKRRIVDNTFLSIFSEKSRKKDDRVA